MVVYRLYLTSSQVCWLPSRPPVEGENGYVWNFLCIGGICTSFEWCTGGSCQHRGNCRWHYHLRDWRQSRRRRSFPWCCLSYATPQMQKMQLEAQPQEALIQVFSLHGTFHHPQGAGSWPRSCQSSTSIKRARSSATLRSSPLLCKFVPKLGAIAEPLRCITRPKAVFE